MPSTSASLNKLLNQMVVPILRDTDFECIDARNALSWRKECILVFEIRAVGSYIADVTGWPPGSVNVWMGAYYTFAPRRPGEIKRDARKRLRPTGPECHLHVPLNRIAVKPRRPGALNAPERRRRDIWWVERDGSNANDVAADIAAALCKQGLRWFADASDLKSAYRLVGKERDCFVKFALAAILAQHIGTKAGWRKYHGLAAKAAERIGESPNPSRWYDIHVGPF